jgi:hypothetical protein
VKKSQWNFLIDAALLLLTASMLGKGLLLKYILVPGKDRRLVYGRNVELELFGLDRHEWGAIHLYVGYVMIALVVLHIVLHWNLIPGMYRKLIGSRALRWGLGTVFVAACTLLVIFPFVLKPTVLEGGEGGGYGRGRGGGSLRQEHEETLTSPSLTGDFRGQGEGRGGRRGGGGIRGSMTLGDIEDEYGIPVGELTKGLGIEGTVPRNERLGRLRQQYDFTMRDVEAVIDKYQKSK